MTKLYEWSDCERIEREKKVAPAVEGTAGHVGWSIGADSQITYIHNSNLSARVPARISVGTDQTQRAPPTKWNRIFDQPECVLFYCAKELIASSSD
jgi:hypothetical protein